ncbi:hypothetical protein Tco_0104392 [Tanacetum coccineum]
MSKVQQERGFGSLPSLTETNPRDQVKSISTTIEGDSHLIRRIESSQYVVSTGLNSTLLYKSRQTIVPFPSRLDNNYCEEEERNYRPKFMKAYGASHINNTIPRKEKDPGRASVSVMPLMTYLNLGLGELAHTRSLDPFLEDHIELNDLNEPFELRINQGDDLMPTIKEGEFLEDMDAYRDEGMGDIIVGEPFLREVGIKAKRF